MATNDQQPLNREQRRRQKFGHAHDTRQDNLRPQSENNTKFNAPPDEVAVDEGPREAITQETTQGATRQTGPGSGGATEHNDRMPNYEGMHGRRGAKG